MTNPNPKANPKASPKAQPYNIGPALGLEGENLRTKPQTKAQTKFRLEDLDILNRYWVECVPCERIRLSLLGGTLERHLRKAHDFTFVEAVDYCTNELRPAIEAKIEASYFKPLEHRGGMIKNMGNLKDDPSPSVGGLNKRQLIKMRKRHGRKLWAERWPIVSGSFTKAQLEAFTKLSAEKFGSTTIRQGHDYKKPQMYDWELVLEESPNYLKVGQDEEFRDEE